MKLGKRGGFVYGLHELDRAGRDALLEGVKSLTVKSQVINLNRVMETIKMMMMEARRKKGNRQKRGFID